jgi:hypothetical protein
LSRARSTRGHDTGGGQEESSSCHTTQQFSNNFTLRLEFRATPNADSGIYVKGPQLQCRDYPLAGPYKQLKHYRAQEWNEMEVTVKDGVHTVCATAR